MINLLHSDIDKESERDGQGTQSLIKAVLVTLIVFAALWAFTKPHFTETNDDFAMSSFAYGYSGSYEFRLMYINVVLGLLLKMLMSVAPNIPWYALLHVVTVFVSFTALFFVLFERFQQPFVTIPIAVIVLVFGYQFIASLQFSKTAGVAIVSGALLMAYAFDCERNHWLYCVLGGLLIFLGSLFRFPVFEMLLPFLFGLLVYVMMGLHENTLRENLTLVAAPVCVVLLACVAGRVLNICSYQLDDGWAACYNNNAVRSDLVDRGFPDYSTHRELYDELGFTENDVNLYSASAYGDPDHYTIETMKRLVDAKDSDPLDVGVYSERLIKAVKGFAKYDFFPALLIVCIWLLLFTIDKKQVIILAVFELAALMLIQAYFIVENRFSQSRVDIVLIFAVVCFFFYASPIRLPREGKGYSLLCALVVGAILVLQVPIFNQYRLDYEADCENSPQAFWDYAAHDKEHFYFYYSSWTYLPDKLYDAFELHEVGYRSNVAPLGSWRFATPIQQDKMLSYGVLNPYRDIVNNDDVLFVCVGDVALTRVLDHIRDHYYPNAEAELVGCIEGKYNIYRIVSYEGGTAASPDI